MLLSFSYKSQVDISEIQETLKFGQNYITKST